MVIWHSRSTGPPHFADAQPNQEGRRTLHIASTRHSTSYDSGQSPRHRHRSDVRSGQTSVTPMSPVDLPTHVTAASPRQWHFRGADPGQADIRTSRRSSARRAHRRSYTAGRTARVGHRTGSEAWPDGQCRSRDTISPRQQPGSRRLLPDPLEGPARIRARKGQGHSPGCEKRARHLRL